MGYQKIDLPFEYDYLEPFIDKETVKLHYTVHHNGYETKLNKAIESKGLETKFPKLIDLMKNYQSVEEHDIKVAIREFGGGLINHNFFWQILKPDVELKDKELKSEIIKKWDSVENFKNEFKKESLNLFGSGWVWLVKRNNGDLKIIKTFNQDNPWFLGFTPIIGIDLWEHSYYLKHNGNRADYIEDFWKVVDWDKAEENFNS